MVFLFSAFGLGGSGGKSAPMLVVVDSQAVPLYKRLGISGAHPAIRAWWYQRIMTNDQNGSNLEGGHDRRSPDGGAIGK